MDRNNSLVERESEASEKSVEDVERTGLVPAIQVNDPSDDIKASSSSTDCNAPSHQNATTQVISNPAASIPDVAAGVARILSRGLPTDRLGVIVGWDITVKDAVDMLQNDYSENILDVAGFCIQNKSSLVEGMTKIVYIPTFVTDLFNSQNNLDNLMYLSTIYQLRLSVDVTTVLAPIRIPEAEGHRTLAKITLSPHESPYRIEVFDPMQTTGTYSEQGNLHGATDEIVGTMKLLRRFMSHVFPTERGWDSDSEWPLSQSTLLIPEIKPQGSDRECGPILILAMMHYANDPSFNDPNLRELMKQGRWSDIRYQQFVKLCERIR